LGKNAPDFRCPQKIGRISAIPILGGLYHQYVRVEVLTKHRINRQNIAADGGIISR
jgi:hypothetical protein